VVVGAIPTHLNHRDRRLVDDGPGIGSFRRS
jgi:hypothetical protein